MRKQKDKVKSILISQPRPSDENSPYFSLASRYKLKVDFHKFITIEGFSTEEFRKQNIKPLDYGAIIFTSKYAVDYLFKVLKELKIEMPPETKYFCVSEATAKYLQKYIVIRKRKLFVGNRTAADLIPLINKHSKEKYLYPCSSIRTPFLPDYLKQNGFDFDEVVIYQTVPSDLSHLKDVTYDLICFYSPSGIQSLVQNFPDFKKRNTRIAVFGPTTNKAAKEAGLEVDIEAPLPNIPSMTAAIEKYLKEIDEQ